MGILPLAIYVLCFQTGQSNARKEAVLQSSEYYVHDSEVQNVLALRIARRFDGQGLTEYY